MNHAKELPEIDSWIVKFYNLMTTSQGKEIIDNGWQTARIADAVHLGLLSAGQIVLKSLTIIYMIRNVHTVSICKHMKHNFTTFMTFL